MVQAVSRKGHGARQWNPRRTISSDVGTMLAAARRAQGWSLREAARQVGCAPGTIVHLEHARRAPSVIIAEAVIAAYQLPRFRAEQLRAEAIPGAGRSSPWKHRRAS